MAKAPAVVIVVRHGARLDAADKSWHLTSPAPYDPPLTYGGWIQSRALGLRIASLLREREKESVSSSSATASSPDSGLGIAMREFGQAKSKRRKHKIVIHSSPFQRCVQTGIGISAGLAQYDGLREAGRKGSDTRVKTVNQLRGASPKLNAADAPNSSNSSSSPKLRPVPELHTDPPDAFRRSLKEQKQAAPRATLRVDAFLGEWLSPDYFEMITPPPNSTLMVAGAKADLLRHADQIDTFSPSSPKQSGNLWGSSTHTRQHAASVSVANPSPLSQETDGPLENWKVLARAVPQRTRTSSAGAYRPTSSHSTVLKHDSSTGYAPPTPTYAISPGDAIPRGYVAHARDHCLQVDYHWDSMREPQRWGDGGQFGEEWSQMHKRFRRGMNSMAEWYRLNSAQIHRQDEHEAVPEASLDQDDDNDDDDDEEVALVLVTHGAGCNALIGALTNQPVLLDVGMASLTMAVRKEASPSASETHSPNLAPTHPRSPAPALPRRRSSLDVALSSLYEIKLVASSDHLRPGVDPSKSAAPVATSSPILPSSQTVPASRSRRFASANSHASAGAPVDSNWNLPEPRTGVNSSLGSARRPSRPVLSPMVTAPTPPPFGSPVASDSPTGLWNPVIAKTSDSPTFTNTLGRSASVSSRLAASDAQPRERSVSPKNPVANTDAEIESSVIEEEAQSAVSKLPSAAVNPPMTLGRSLSQKGLWGSAPSGAIKRETGIPKRRWTVAQD